MSVRTLSLLVRQTKQEKKIEKNRNPACCFSGFSLRMFLKKYKNKTHKKKNKLAKELDNSKKEKLRKKNQNNQEQKTVVVFSQKGRDGGRLQKEEGCAWKIFRFFRFQ